MVAPVVEPVLCPQVLRKRGNAGQALVDQLRLAERAAADLELVGHAARFRTEVAVGSQHALGQRKDIDSQIEQVLDRVVVLKAVHAPHRRVRQRGARFHRAVQKLAQLGHESLALLHRHARLALGGHDPRVKRLDQVPQQLGIPGEVGGAVKSRQVDVSEQVPAFAVALDATLAKYRLENALQNVSLGRLQRRHQESRCGSEADPASASSELPQQALNHESAFKGSPHRTTLARRRGPTGVTRETAPSTQVSAIVPKAAVNRGPRPPRVSRPGGFVSRSSSPPAPAAPRCVEPLPTLEQEPAVWLAYSASCAARGTLRAETAAACRRSSPRMRHPAIGPRPGDETYPRLSTVRLLTTENAPATTVRAGVRDRLLHGGVHHAPPRSPAHSAPRCGSAARPEEHSD